MQFGPEFAQGEDREGVRPGEGRGRGGDAGSRVDPLGEHSGSASPPGAARPSGAARRAARRARRGSTPSRRSGAVQGSLPPPQPSEGTIPKRPLWAASRSSVRRSERVERRVREGPHRPGGGRVEARAGVAGAPGQRPRGRLEQRSDLRLRRRRSRWRGNRRRRSPGSRPAPRHGRSAGALGSPAARRPRRPSRPRPPGHRARRPACRRRWNRAAAPRSSPRRKPTMRRASPR